MRPLSPTPVGLEQRLLARARAEEFRRGDVVVVGFSGGRDSLALAGALRSPYARTRHAAVWALSRMNTDAARDALVEVLRDDDPEVRAEAARALGGTNHNPWPWPRPRPFP